MNHPFPGTIWNQLLFARSYVPPELRATTERHEPRRLSRIKEKRAARNEIARVVAFATAAAVVRIFLIHRRGILCRHHHLRGSISVRLFQFCLPIRNSRADPSSSHLFYHAGKQITPSKSYSAVQALRRIRNDICSSASFLIALLQHTVTERPVRQNIREHSCSMPSTQWILGRGLSTPRATIKRVLMTSDVREEVLTACVITQFVLILPSKYSGWHPAHE
jgi:hypothetical protein